MSERIIWNCEQVEARLSDYLDHLLEPAERAAFAAHAENCGRCAPLLASVSHVLIGLHELEPLEVPPRLVYNILDKTLGPRDTISGWRVTLAWLRTLASAKFAYGALSVAATVAVLLAASGFSWRQPKFADLRPTNVYRNADRQAHLVYARGSKFVSDLRVVYEIQSRLRPGSENPAAPESTVPDSGPQKQPGQTNGPQQSTPRQLNRANGIRPDLSVLATCLTVLTDRRIL